VGAEGARFRPTPAAGDARGGAPRRAAAAEVEAADAGAGGLAALAVGRALPRLAVRPAGGAAGGAGSRACGAGGAGSPALGTSAMVADL
jgi:hypothetical protein